MFSHQNRWFCYATNCPLAYKQTCFQYRSPVCRPGILWQIIFLIRLLEASVKNILVIAQCIKRIGYIMSTCYIIYHLFSYLLWDAPVQHGSVWFCVLEWPIRSSCEHQSLPSAPPQIPIRVWIPLCVWLLNPSKTDTRGLSNWLASVLFNYFAIISCRLPL